MSSVQPSLSRCTANSLAAFTLLLTSSAFAARYTFDSLTAGPLIGQDNWVSHTGVTVAPGSNGGQTITGSNPLGLPAASAARLNNAAFTFPALTSNVAQIGFDFRMNPAAQVTSAVAQLALAESDHGYGSGEGEVGIRFSFMSAVNFDQIMIMRGDGAAYAGGARNFTHVHGHWYRVVMTLDLSPNYYNTPEGPCYGRATVTVQDLTTGTPASPVTMLQNAGLYITADGATPSRYDRMDIQLAAVEMDNLTIINGTPCPADFNSDGFLDFTDFDAFVAGFEVGDVTTDYNADGFLDFTDFDAFVTVFESGC